jgi:DNA-directed RNA polymerase specialized sigma24 family protein
MSINNYINKHFKEIKQKIKAVTRNHQNTDDLISDCILSLLEKGPDYLSQLVRDNKVQHYLVKMAYIQYNSSTSPFHLKYRKSLKLQSLDDTHKEVKQEQNGEEYNTDKFAKDVKIYIGNLPFYQKELATQHFIQGKSQRKMSKQYNINRMHISKDIKLIKKNMQITFNKEKYRNDE